MMMIIIIIIIMIIIIIIIIVKSWSTGTMELTCGVAVSCASDTVDVIEREWSWGEVQTGDGD